MSREFIIKVGGMILVIVTYVVYHIGYCHGYEACIKKHVEPPDDDTPNPSPPALS